MADAEPSSVTVGQVPEHLRGGADMTNIDRDGHILIRREQPPFPDEEDLDAGPDIDHERKEYRPATYKLRSGNIRRDF